MLFCVDTGGPYSCIEDKALENIIHHSGCRSILLIDYKSDFKFGNTLVRPRDMVELMLPTPGSTLDVPVILDFVDVKIPQSLESDVLDETNLLVDNATNHSWNRMITNRYRLRFEGIWNVKLITRGDHLYVPPFTPIQLLYIMAQLRKPHKKFPRLSTTKRYDPLRASVTKTVTP